MKPHIIKPCRPVQAPSTSGSGEANVLKALGDLYVRNCPPPRTAGRSRISSSALPQYKAIDERLGEANVLWALGDLYVRTARLKDAEAAYNQGPPQQYQAIDARLGEANVRKALGNLYVRTDRLKDAEAAYNRSPPPVPRPSTSASAKPTSFGLSETSVRPHRSPQGRRSRIIIKPSRSTRPSTLASAKPTSLKAWGTLALAKGDATGGVSAIPGGTRPCIDRARTTLGSRSRSASISARAAAHRRTILCERSCSSCGESPVSS